MKTVFLALIVALLSACVTEHSSQTNPHETARYEPRPFDETADARADVDATIQRAGASDKMALIVMGADWCHDSRALAAQFEKSRFQTLIGDHFELVYVDVGQKDRNIDIARDFGVENIVGTPTVFVINGKGEVLNLGTAPSWRNAASRSESEIYTYFRDFAHPAH